MPPTDPDQGDLETKFVMEELAEYFEHFVHVKYKMSSQVESIYN